MSADGRGSAAAGRVAGRLIDLVFPMSCVGCRREGRYLCQTCEAGLPKLERPYCSVCAEPGQAATCGRCLELSPPLERIRAPYLFEGAVRDMVHGLKYRGLRAGAPDMGRLLAAFFESSPMPADVIIPVPLHRRSLRDRGYNQSELLGIELSKRTGRPMETRLLSRVRSTPPQVSMAGDEERRRNVEGAFDCGSDVGGKRVLLVDDVVTTGSTMSACGAALRQSGAGAVSGLALARQG